MTCEKRWSFSASQHYSLLRIRKSGPVYTSLSNVWLHESLLGKRKTELFTCVVSVCPSWSYLSALEELCIDCPSCFIKSLELAQCTPEPAREQQGCACSRLSGRCCGLGAVLSCGDAASGDAHGHACVGPSLVLVLYMLLLSVFTFFPLHLHILLLGSTLPIYLLMCIICTFSSFWCPSALGD